MSKGKLQYGFAISPVLIITSILAIGFFVGYRYFLPTLCSFEWGCPDLKLNKDSSYYQDKAVIDKNPDLCNKLKGFDDGDFKIDSSVARQNCLVNYATKTGDLAVCESVKESNKPFANSKDMCLQSIAIEQDNFEICKKIINSRKKDECFDTLRIKNNSQELCFEMSTDLMRECLGDLLKTDPNSEYCAKTNNTKLADQCYYYVAIKTLDQNLCEKLQDWDSDEYDSRVNCRFRIEARKGFDLNICNDVEATSGKDLCYLEMAFFNNAPEVCELVGVSRRKECLRNLEKGTLSVPVRF